MAGSRLILDAVSASLHTWIEENDLESVRDGIAYLLEFSGTFATRDSEGRSYLNHVVALNNPAMVSLFVEQLEREPTVLHSRDNYNNTVCHLAAQSNALDILKMYIEKLAQLENGHNRINLKNWYGDTALHFAMQMQEIEVMVMLMNAGADWNIKNKKKQSPLMLFVNLPRDVKTRMFALLKPAIRAQFYNDLIQDIEANNQLEPRSIVYVLWAGKGVSQLWEGVSLSDLACARLNLDRRRCLALMSSPNFRQQKLIASFPGSGLTVANNRSIAANLEPRTNYWRVNHDIMRMQELMQAIDTLLDATPQVLPQFTTEVIRYLNLRFWLVALSSGLALLGSALFINLAISTDYGNATPSLQLSTFSFWGFMMAGTLVPAILIIFGLRKIVYDQDFVTNWRPFTTVERQVNQEPVLHHAAWDRLVAKTEELFGGEEEPHNAIILDVRQIRLKTAALKTNLRASSVHLLFGDIKTRMQSVSERVASNKITLPSSAVNRGLLR